MIPKLIHFTAPKEIEKWHPLWNKCLESWKKCYSSDQYEIIVWNHEEIDEFIKNNYSEEWKFYEQFPFHIMKLAFFRYCVLYKYGGIYSDMDMYCYKNFYSSLQKESYLVESWGESQKELVQNSLMISVIGNQFFRNCINESIQNFSKLQTKINPSSITLNDTKYSLYVRGSMGTIFLSSYYKKCLGDKKLYTPSVLPKELFNAPYFKYSENYVTKHMLTGVWGKENLAKTQAEYKVNYNDSRKISLEDFDFYKNYF